MIGDGHVFRHSPDGKLLQEYATEANGGMFGFLAVTSTVLADNDTRMIFVSETGKRVMQYDLKNRQAAAGPGGLRQQPGRAHGPRHEPHAGRPAADQHRQGLPRHGPEDRVRCCATTRWRAWAGPPSIRPPDGQFAIIGNFFTGDIVKVRLSDAAIVARNNVGQKESLSGIAQFPG